MKESELQLPSVRVGPTTSATCSASSEEMILASSSCESRTNEDTFNLQEWLLGNGCTFDPDVEEILKGFEV